ncbi:MAG: hypothetical protein HKN04_11255 [Rhodothermaceae bacterium]|nr:hypothetical protein [Rhodothermaceae bacterium]
MKRTVLTGLLSVALLSAFSGCGGCGVSEEERRAAELEEAAEELSEAAERMGEATGNEMAEAMEGFGEALGGALGANADNADLEPVEREALRNTVPESMGGMERTNISSAREGAMGMTVTHAEAEFRDGESRFEYKVTDMAGVPFMAFGAMWMNAEIDRESDSEIERTMTYRGHRGYEKYNSNSNSGELSFIVNGFWVEGRGYNMSRDQIQNAMDDAPVRELEGLR